MTSSSKGSSFCPLRLTRLWFASTAIIFAAAAFSPVIASAQDASPAPAPAAAPVKWTCPTRDPAEPQAIWNTDTYGCVIALGEQDKPIGIGGGKLQSFDLPKGAFLTKVHIFKDAKRIYGLKFAYKLRGGRNPDEEIETEVIGGTSGDMETVELDYQKRLHSIKGYYGPDPDKHYQTQVLVGIEIANFKFNPLDPAYKATSTAPYSFNDMVERRYFGAAKTANTSIGGPEVHLIQVLRGFNACVSPTDRNGRIFGLGFKLAGPVRAHPAGTEFCPNVDPRWALQPLGPKKVKNELANPNRLTFDPKLDSPFDFASGMYESYGDKDVKRIPATNRHPKDYRGSIYQEPNIILADFGDTATLRFGKETNAAFSLQLVVDDAKKGAAEAALGEVGFDFIYAGATDFLGVKITPGTPSEGDGAVRSHATLYYKTLQPGGVRFNGEYREVRLRDQNLDPVASREKLRPELVKREATKKGLFEIGANKGASGYIYSGYFPPEMDLIDHNLGKAKTPIFSESGQYQYYSSDVENKIVNDGLILELFGNGWTDDKVTTLSNASETAESVSHSFTAGGNFRGVTAGMKYAQTESESRNKSNNTVRGFAIAQYYDFALIQDIPNAFLSQQFTDAVKGLFSSPSAQLATRADRLVEVFGTHYAHAVIYGGMGQLTTEMDEITFAKERSKSQSYGANVGIDVPGKIPQGKTSENDREQGKAAQAAYEGGRTKMTRNSSNTQVNKSYWTQRGGGGTFSAASWSVPRDSGIPIFYDLRPVYDLIEPVILYKVFDSVDKIDGRRSGEVRNAIKVAFEKRLNSYPKAPPEPNRGLFEMKITGIRCEHGGDDGKNATIDLYGTIKLEMTEGKGEVREVIIFDNPDKNIPIKCDSKLTTDGLSAPPQLTWVTDGDQLSAKFSLNIDEDDDSVINRDDHMEWPLGIDPPVDGKLEHHTVQWSDPKRPDLPIISIDLTWEQIE